MNEIIAVELSLNEPLYLCRDSKGNLYISQVEKWGNEFSEKKIKECTMEEAKIFVAGIVRNAMNKLVNGNFQYAISDLKGAYMTRENEG